MNISDLSPESTEALLVVCLLASFADGAKSSPEHEEIRRMAAEFEIDDAGALIRRVLRGHESLESATSRLGSARERLLAYEMALAVCEADRPPGSEESTFLKSLRDHLGLDSEQIHIAEAEVNPLVLAPVETPASAQSASGNGGLILKYAILTGALELLPETLATMSILPVQMKMVYRIGDSHGARWNRSRIQEFLAVAGIGMGSQMLEGFARKMLGGWGRKLAGKPAGKIASQTTGSILTFATTYAIGHLADHYHRQGGRLNQATARELLASLKEKARELHASHWPEIQAKAASLKSSNGSFSLGDLIR